MASSLKNLSDYNPAEIPSAKGKRIALVVAEWHNELTFSMRDATIETLKKKGATNDDLCVNYVPGSFELTLGAKWLAETKEIEAVICIGCVIRGETPHFDYICESLAFGLTELNIKTGKPIIFGVLTTENIQQAKARAGGKLGNKGTESAVAALKMLGLNDSLKK